MSARPRRDAADDRGSSSVLVVGVLGAVLSATVGALAVASAVEATHRARSAADLSALAAAQALEGGSTGGAACAEGAWVAGQNHATPLSCEVATDGSVTVAVSATLRMVIPGMPEGPAVATARAGPAPGTAR